MTETPTSGDTGSDGPSPDESERIEDAEETTDDRAVDGAGKQSTGVTTTTLTSNYKVLGDLTASDGVGVLGHNDADNGTPVGVRGRASTSGVLLETYGVEGISAATGDLNNVDPSGVKGLATGSGHTIGVKGVTESPTARAAGVKAEVNNGDANAIVAEANNDGFAIEATSNAQSVPAIEGRSTGALGGSFAHGVNGETFKENDGVAGTRGFAFTDKEFQTFGVKGETQSQADASTSTFPAGVLGYASNTTGETHGVRGTVDSDIGYAVYADGRFRASDSLPLTNSTKEKSYMGFVENSFDGDGLVLGLKKGITNDPGPGVNFVSFLSPDGSGGIDIHGAIEGDGNGGVTNASSGSDYAEWLPRRDPESSMEPGDVVGVHGGEVSLTTEDADRAMVVSTQPVVLGNDPGPLEGARADYEKVAFVGQAPTRVRGPVADGDLVVPSGENDGTAVAVTPGERPPGTPVVGQAWERDDSEGVTTVTVAVGIDDPAMVATEDLTRGQVENGDRESDTLQAELERRDDRIDEQAARIDALEDENDRLRERLAALEARVETPSASADD